MTSESPNANSSNPPGTAVVLAVFPKAHQADIAAGLLQAQKIFQIESEKK